MSFPEKAVPSDESKWYRIYWNFIHKAALGCTTATKKETYKRLMLDGFMQSLLQCDKCIDNYTNHFDELKTDITIDPFKWSVELHNLVNRDTNKRIINDITSLSHYYQSLNWKRVYWDFIHKSAASCDTQFKTQLYFTMMIELMPVIWYTSEFHEIIVNITHEMNSFPQRICIRRDNITLYRCLYWVNYINLLDWSLNLQDRLDPGEVRSDSKHYYLADIPLECSMCNDFIIPPTISEETVFSKKDISEEILNTTDSVGDVSIKRNKKVKMPKKIYRSANYLSAY